MYLRPIWLRTHLAIYPRQPRVAVVRSSPVLRLFERTEDRTDSHSGGPDRTVNWTVRTGPVRFGLVRTAKDRKEKGEERIVCGVLRRVGVSMY